MSKRINRNIADVFSTALEETEDWHPKISLRELVEEAFISIEKARIKKATWEQIAGTLQKTIGEEAVIKPDTVRQYYFDAMSKREETSKQQQQKPAKNLSKVASSAEKTVTQVIPNQLPWQDSPVAESIISPDASQEPESSFNRRPRKKKEEMTENG